MGAMISTREKHDSWIDKRESKEGTGNSTQERGERGRSLYPTNDWQTVEESGYVVTHPAKSARGEWHISSVLPHYRGEVFP